MVRLTVFVSATATAVRRIVCHGTQECQLQPVARILHVLQPPEGDAYQPDGMDRPAFHLAESEQLPSPC